MKTMFWSTLIYAGVLVAAYNHASFAGNVLAVVCTAGYLYVLGSTLREWLERREVAAAARSSSRSSTGPRSGKRRSS